MEKNLHNAVDELVQNHSDHQENHAADIEEQPFDEIPEDLDEDLKEAPLLDLDYIEEPGVDELEEISPEELENALKNYDINIVDGDATIGKAKLDVYVDNIKTEYGTAFDENKYGYTVKEEDLANGDKVDAVRDEIDNKNNISMSNLN